MVDGVWIRIHNQSLSITNMDQIWGEYGLVAKTFYWISLSIREREGMHGNRGFNPKEKGNHGGMGTGNKERERERERDCNVTSANWEHMLLEPGGRYESTMLGRAGDQGYDYGE
jgi:hypothetical protein